LLYFIILLNVSPLFAGNAFLQWKAPTTNEDGTPLTDLSGYKIYYGTASGNYSKTIDVGNVTTYTITNLTDGVTYYFAATAYDRSMNESRYSNEVNKIILLAEGNVSNPSIKQCTLHISKSRTGSGSGTVSSSPVGISCGADCSEAYTSGTVLTLTATADESSTFSGWTGACTGTGNCTVTMDAAKTVTATFTLKTYTITASAGSGGSITPSGTITVNHGASQAFTITANTDYTVGGVVVDGSSVGSVTSYTFTNVTANHTISASFAAVEDNSLMPDTIDLPKTGQTVSYVPGDDGSIQAGIEWPTARFTDNSDGTVTDNLTGLMWLKDGGCLRKNWNNSLRAIKDLNSNSGIINCLEYAAVYNDWRLPNVNELESLVNYGASDTSKWLNIKGFVDMKSYPYWSSTTYQSSTTRAWIISMNNGLGSQSGKSNTLYFLPVRDVVPGNPQELASTRQTVKYAQGDDGSIQAGFYMPSPRFNDNDDGTVTDNLTGLMWLKDGGCFRKSWNTIFDTIKDFNRNPGFYNCFGYIASYTDWRLPNIKELESLINYEAVNLSGWLNTEGFLNVKSSFYWSSTTYQGSTTQAWRLDMQRANRSFKRKSYSYYAWPVRGGTVKGK
jgi:hypothetical protein